MASDDLKRFQVLLTAGQLKRLAKLAKRPASHGGSVSVGTMIRRAVEGFLIQMEADPPPDTASQLNRLIFLLASEYGERSNRAVHCNEPTDKILDAMEDDAMERWRHQYGEKPGLQALTTQVMNNAKRIPQ